MANLPPTTSTNPLLNPGQQLSGKALLQAAQALTRSQTTGPMTELARQIMLNNRQGAAAGRKTAGYFKQLGRFTQGGVNQEKGIANDLNNQLRGISQQTQQQLTQYGQQGINSPSEQSLGRTGLDGGSLAALSSELARQKGVAAQNAGTYRSAGALQGANYRGLAASNLGSFALGGQERLGQIAQASRLANEPINAKIAGLRASQGSLLAANEGKLRQQEIANKFTSRGLGLKDKALNITQQNDLANQSLRAQDISNTKAYNDASIRISQINAQLSAGKLTETQRHNLITERQTQEKIRETAIKDSNKKNAKGPQLTSTGTRALTQNEQNRVFSFIDNAHALIPQMQQPLTDAAAKSLNDKAGGNFQGGQRLSEAQIRHLLAVGVHPGGNTRFTPAEIDAAYALAGYGYLTNKQITELNKMGVVVGNHYRRQPTVGAGLTAIGRG